VLVVVETYVLVVNWVAILVRMLSRNPKEI
jgi:hypothetical protein